MVSNEEIKRMLENRRRGIKTEAKKESPQPVSPSTSRKPMKSGSQSCESCGAQNPADAKFCIKCGDTLQKAEEKKPAETPDTLPRSGMDGIDYQTCPNCSHQNKPQAKFCVVCGHKLDQEEVTPPRGSLLDRVPAEPVNQPPEEETPAVAELIDEESIQEETQSRSLLSRKVAEEELEETPTEATNLEVPREDMTGKAAEVTTEAELEEEVHTEAEMEEAKKEVPVEEDTMEDELEPALPEEVPATGIAPEEAAPEEDELPQVKTFKFGSDSLEMEEPAAEEVAEDSALTGAESSPEDPMEKIKKAKELLDIGAITEEEFEEIKKKYLSLI